jgi:hypothetical protein
MRFAIGQRLLDITGLAELRNRFVEVSGSPAG